MWAFIEAIGVILLLVWAFKDSGSTKKKNNYTSHYSGGFTMNHTPPPTTDREMTTQKFPSGYNGELNKKFESK